MRNPLIILLIASTLISVGCLTTSEPTEPKRMDLTFFATDIGTLIQAGEDSLVVNEFKFAVNRFNVVDSDSTILQSTSQIDTFIHFFNTDFTEQNLVFSVELGFEDVNEFESYDMFVEPVPENANIADSDFYGDPENYSLIISGTFNDRTFTYFSSVEFEKTFEFSTVQLTGTNETLLIEKQILIEDMFTNPSTGSLIDPRDSENAELLDSQFKNHIHVNATASTIYLR